MYMEEKKINQVILVDTNCCEKPQTKLECLIMLNNNAQYSALIWSCSRTPKFWQNVLKFYKMIPIFVVIQARCPFNKLIKTAGT